MEKENITINGDILINFNLSDDLFNDCDDDFFEDNEYDKYDEDEFSVEETDDEPDLPDLSLFVSGLPSDVDSKKVEAVMEAAADAIKSVLEQAVERTDGGGRHEGV